jgi:hypothetical protein
VGTEGREAGIVGPRGEGSWDRGARGERSWDRGARGEGSWGHRGAGRSLHRRGSRSRGRGAGHAGVSSIARRPRSQVHLDKRRDLHRGHHLVPDLRTGSTTAGSGRPERHSHSGACACVGERERGRAPPLGGDVSGRARAQGLLRLLSGILSWLGMEGGGGIPSRGGLGQSDPPSSREGAAGGRGRGCGLY